MATYPILLDSTGQDIVTKLEAIKDALNPGDYVRFTPQTLTDEQKAQARANIGAQALNPGATDFAVMQQNIQDGNGASMYPVGSIFYVPHTGIIDGVTIDLPFEVVAHDHYTIPGKAHTMTAVALYGIKKLQISNKCGFYNTGENGLTAGAYSWKYNTTTLYFNLPSGLGANKLLYRDSNTKATIYDIATWANEGQITMQTSAIAGATALGNSGDSDYKIPIHSRLDSGNPNFGQSWLRQWLNSSGAANEIWFSQKTPWDNFSGIAVSGFLYGMNPDFLNIVGNTEYVINTLAYEYPYQLPDTQTVVYPQNSTATLTDKFFLLSRREVGLENTTPEGTVLEKYDGASATDRIKSIVTAPATPENWWLRSPYNASGESYVNSSGVGGYTYAYYTYSVVPACNIC